jgi:hypothetical protein
MKNVTLNMKPVVMATREEDLSNLLLASIELVEKTKLVNKIDAQLTMATSQLDSALSLFESRFDSDCSELNFEELNWYVEASLVVENITGRVHKAEQVKEYMFHRTTGL